jgi:hypothetical protein
LRLFFYVPIHVYLSTAEKDSESKIADQLSYKTTQASSTERLKLEEPDLLHGSRQNAKHDMKEVYRLALDAFIPLGDGLTHHMKYLALELNSLEGISAEERGHFERFNPPRAGSVQESLYNTQMGNGK